MMKSYKKPLETLFELFIIDVSRCFEQCFEGKKQEGMIAKIVEKEQLETPDASDRSLCDYFVNERSGFSDRSSYLLINTHVVLSLIHI